MHNYEIEIKSLLDSKKKADDLIERMKRQDPNLKILGSHKQLNHYFIGGNLNKLVKKIQTFVESEKLEKLKHIALHAKEYSVRTRWADSKVLLVIKASINDTTSFNGTARIEWENLIDLELDKLDELALKSGFEYQSKWSRERSEYNYKGLYVTVDKNAGYGYVAEFEKQVDDESLAEQTKREILAAMKELGINELPQDRLERMFKFYNDNWQEYYETDKIFNIK